MAGSTRLRAGSLRQRIDIQRNTPTQNSLGEEVDSWADIASSVPAKVEPMAGNEVFQADTTLSDTPVMFTVRYTTNYTPDVEDRVVWDGNNYDIRSVRNIDARDWAYEITAVLRA